MTGFYDLGVVVDCDSCGHDIAQHDPKGCQIEECPCRIGFTKKLIRTIQKESQQ